MTSQGIAEPPYGVYFTIPSYAIVNGVCRSKDVAEAMMEKVEEHFRKFKDHFWNALICHYEKYNRIPDSLVSCVLIGEGESDDYNLSEVNKEFCTLTNEKYKGKYGEVTYYGHYDDGPRTSIGQEFFGQFAPDKLTKDMLEKGVFLRNRII